jgi:methylated-DNA-protein-cysteine methyltransferase-like protein
LTSAQGSRAGPPGARRSARPARLEGFFARVYRAVRAVPRGAVVTYGELARLLGKAQGARAVGWALRALPAGRSRSVPWHRVVGHGGRISPRSGPGPELQRRRLAAEGVRFVNGRVDMARHGLAARRRRGRAARRPLRSG